MYRVSGRGCDKINGWLLVAAVTGFSGATYATARYRGETGEDASNVDPANADAGGASGTDNVAPANVDGVGVTVTPVEVAQSESDGVIPIVGSQDEDIEDTDIQNTDPQNTDTQNTEQIGDDGTTGLTNDQGQLGDNTQLEQLLDTSELVGADEAAADVADTIQLFQSTGGNVTVSAIATAFILFFLVAMSLFIMDLKSSPPPLLVVALVCTGTSLGSGCFTAIDACHEEALYTILSTSSLVCIIGGVLAIFTFVFLCKGSCGE